MKKTWSIVAFLLIAVLLLSGCQPTQETLAPAVQETAQADQLQEEMQQLQAALQTLAEQNAQLQQSVQTLTDEMAKNAEQQTAQTETTTPEETAAPSETPTATQAPKATQKPAETKAPSNDQKSQNQADTYMVEELTRMVNDFLSTADEAAKTATRGDSDSFYVLKREADQVERAIDSYEDEVKAQYRSGTLSRDAYRELDRQLEQLEDQLDNAEDSLERAFGIDD